MTLRVVPRLRTVMLSSSLSDFQREMRCATGRMDARRGAQALALPLPSVATQQTPSRRAIRRTEGGFGAWPDQKGLGLLSEGLVCRTFSCSKIDFVLGQSSAVDPRD